MLFLEDIGHEDFIISLLKRIESEFNVELEIIPRNVRGGCGKMISELKQFLRDLERSKDILPDLIVVARDANCKGVAARERELDDVVKQSNLDQSIFIYAIPDPHLERWLLLDSHAFKLVLGRGCQAPDLKCDRNRYKKLLREAVRNAGVQPLLGGLEYTDEIVAAMDLDRVKGVDHSLGRFIGELRARFKRWQIQE
ncbi:MAG: hypothetical protein ACPGVO_06450 [Spirulinaceae cyanobacterium]